MPQSSSWTPTEGGVTAPCGFQAAGITAGLKESGKPDLALLLAPQDAVCAGTFTTSVVRAACVDLCAERLQSSAGQCRAVLINSGQANACTGDRGLIDSQRATQVLADQLGLSCDQVLICSTGVIGVPISMQMTRVTVQLQISANVETDIGAFTKTQFLMLLGRYVFTWYSFEYFTHFACRNAFSLSTWTSFRFIEAGISERLYVLHRQLRSSSFTALAKELHALILSAL